LKGYQLATEPVLGDGLLESRWFLIGVVEFEVFFGLWLLAGAVPQLTRLAAIACFGAFALVSFIKAASGEATCGCFGKVAVNPWYTCTLDLIAVALLLQCRPDARSPERVGGWRKRAILVAAGWLLLAIPTAYAIAGFRPLEADAELTLIGQAFEGPAGKPMIVLEPDRWIGRPFPLMAYVESGTSSTPGGELPLRERLRKDTSLVILHRSGCADCQLFLERLQHDTRLQGRYHTVVALELPPFDASQDRLNIGGKVETGRLEERALFFARTPLVVAMEQGVVRDISYGDGKESSAAVSFHVGDTP
jgi:hypothetical protein